MVAPRKIVHAVVEAVIRGEEIKPVQEAVRRVFYRYGITDETLFRRFSGLTYNLFKNYGLIDYIVEKICNIKARNTDALTRGILRVAGYVLQVDPIIDDKWRHRFYRYLIDYAKKKLGPHAATVLNAIEKLNSTKWRPQTGYEKLMVRYRIYPGLYELIKDALTRLGENPEELLKSIEKPPPHTFRVNQLKASPKAILNYLKTMGYKVEPGRYSPRAIRLYGSLGRDVLRLIETGVITPQDEASMIAVELLPLEEGLVVADLCAAPGNKTSYLAELTKLKVEIHAFDINRDRIKRMKSLLERTGTDKAVRIYHADARRATDILGLESVDIALVDPPCSSTGAIARNPDVRWRFNASELEDVNRLQKQILSEAVKLTRRGGYILYTTCSLLPSEGEEVVKYVLSEYNELKIVRTVEPFKESPVLPSTMRSYPHLHNVTGFYYALLKKC